MSNNPTNKTIIARLANIAKECRNDPKITEYSQSDYEWIPCIKYKTDCMGLLCEILYECRQKKAQKLYKSLLEFARKNKHKLYPSDLPRICLARCLFQYIQETKTSGIKRIAATKGLKLERGDLIVWEYSTDPQVQTCTGHLIFFWSYKGCNHLEAIECSPEKNGIGFIDYDYEIVDNKLFLFSHLKQKYMEAIVGRITC